MRVPLDWLADFVALPDRRELAERLTLGGLEVEAIEEAGPNLAGIRIGRVIERAPHPNADRLSLCRVDVGESEPREIVCGASNVAADQKVAVALPGQRLPDGTKLKRTKIRGVVSNGMICSASELGLGDDREGILVLDPAAPVGAELGEVFGGAGAVLEVALTPNRGDCASLLGIAREVRAHFGGAVRLPPCDPPEGRDPVEESVQVAIEDPEGCPRYVARLVRGVSVGPSPAWLRARLEAAGLRPINNVVDVTNLVLLELGQPLHAFDWAKLRGEMVRVRRAQAGEKLVTLDGQHRALDPEDLVIADAERPIAVAGVMGGAESEVGGQTRDVLLESAQFHPVRVRRMARRLGLQTEASYRFERGVDREGVRRAADRAARLLAELAGGSVLAGAVEATGRALPAREEIELDPERVNRLLGTELEGGEIAELLERVGVRAQGGRTLRCRVPSHRNDLERAEDLVEEVARVYGYERIPTTLPVGELAPPRPEPLWRFTETVRTTLQDFGFVECMSLPFARPDEADRLGLAEGDPRRRTVRLENPLVEDEPELRATLVASLLRLVHRNRSHQVERVRLFEVARVFRGAGGADALPEERLQVAAVLTPEDDARLWKAYPDVPLFFEAKGFTERLLRALGYAPAFGATGPEPFLHPGASLELVVEGERVGVVGELHPETAARFEVDVPCALWVVDLERLRKLEPRAPRYREISRQPRVRRDLALLLPREVTAGEVMATIRREGGPLLVAVDVFDRYEGRGVPEGRVSVAFRLVFQRGDRALTDEEVGRATDRIVRVLAERHRGELR